MKKPTVPVRSQMLAKFDVFAGAFAHCVHTLQPFGVAVSELQNWVYKVRFGLETAPFLGLVVKSPPPPHLDFSLYVDVRNPGAPKRNLRRQNPAFVKWFQNLPKLEVRSRPRHGAVAYRMIQITPQCETERVKFHSTLGWLSARTWNRHL